MSKKRIEMQRDETADRTNSPIDWLDKFVFGPMNLINSVALNYIKQAMHPSKGGLFGPTVQVTMPAMSKGGKVSHKQCKDHLESHGVPTFRHTHDDQNFYFNVRETNYTWAMWLLDDGKGLKYPKSNWKDDRPKKKKPTRQPLDVGKLIDRIF